MGQFFRSLANAPLEFPFNTSGWAASSGKARRKPRDCRRAALSIGFRPGKTAFLWRSLAFLQLDLFRQGCSATSTGPKTSCSLLSSRNGNHAASFVDDECDDPVEQRGCRFITCTRRSNGKPRTRKMPTLRGPTIAPRRRRSIRAVWRVCHGQTKRNGEVFRRHTFPPFWLMNSKLTKLAAAAGPRI